MKTIARQIAPENQNPHLYSIINNKFVWEDDYYKDIAILAPKNFYSIIPSAVQSVLDVLEDGEFADNIDSINRYGEEKTWFYTTKEEAVSAFFPNGNYTSEEIEIICEQAIQYGCFNSTQNRNVLCKILSITTGMKYVWKTIHGLSQGEYADIVYPLSCYNDDDISTIESEYFNTGSEWCIDDDYNVYCHSLSDADIKSELAAITGCNENDLEMYKFKGYKKIAEYELV